MSQFDVRVVPYPPLGVERMSRDHWREFHDYDPEFRMEFLKRASCIQAFDNGAPIGYLFMYVFEEPYIKGKVGMIDLYYLDPRYRGKKLSNRMFELAEKTAKEQGAGRITASANVLKPHSEFFRLIGMKQTHVMYSKVI